MYCLKINCFNIYIMIKNCIYSINHNGIIKYIGSTQKFNKRISDHKYEMRRCYKRKLYKYLLENGFKNMTFEVLEDNVDKTELKKKEQDYINKYRTTLLNETNACRNTYLTFINQQKLIE